MGTQVRDWTKIYLELKFKVSFPEMIPETLQNICPYYKLL